MLFPEQCSVIMSIMQPTHRTKLYFFLSMLLALLVPLEVIAQPEQGSELSIAGSALHFAYQEFNDTGKLLDREDGYIPGLVIGLSQTVDRWLFAGDFSFYAGNVIYTGQTNTGIPISTRTRQRIIDIAVHTEYWLQSDKGLSYAFYVGAGYHQWDRNIQPTITASGTPVSGLLETYEWWSGFLGTKAVLHESESVRLLLDARILRTVNPAISIYFNGQYDNARLALGERWGVRVSLPLRYTLNTSSSLNVEPYAESYELGRSTTAPLTSNGKVVGSVYEPLSQTINYGLTVGISQHF